MGSKDDGGLGHEWGRIGQDGAAAPLQCLVHSESVKALISGL